MIEMEHDDKPVRPGSPGVSMLIIVGVIALVGAVAAYTQENSSHSLGGEKNYALALLMLGFGAFMLLLAAIVSSGRRR